jgi:hypothetical protein
LYDWRTCGTSVVCDRLLGLVAGAHGSPCSSAGPAGCALALRGRSRARRQRRTQRCVTSQQGAAHKRRLRPRLVAVALRVMRRSSTGESAPLHVAGAAAPASARRAAHSAAPAPLAALSVADPVMAGILLTAAAAACSAATASTGPACAPPPATRAQAQCWASAAAPRAAQVAAAAAPPAPDRRAGGRASARAGRPLRCGWRALVVVV